MEAAIDEPQMFADGYTHYSSQKGFHALHNNSEFDNYLGYVSSIDATESKNESRNWNYPHPKWYEFRKRIDKVVKSIKDDWDLKDVFIEAWRNNKLHTYLRKKITKEVLDSYTAAKSKQHGFFPLLKGFPRHEKVTNI